MVQCTAKSKRSGLQCQRQAMHGKSVCYMHGGKTPVGLASPHFVTGRYSKHMPARLMERYEESLSDKKLLQLREEIALLDARLADLLKRVDSGESGKSWDEARKAYDNLRYSMTNRDQAGIAQALTNLDRLIGQGQADYDAWDEIRTIIDQRRRLVESEVKHLALAHQMLTTEEVLSFAVALVEIVKEHVKDQKIITAIGTDFARLTENNSRRGVDIEE